MTVFSLTSIHSQPFLRSDSHQVEEAKLVEEIPLSININGITHAVMMVTPVNLDAFAIGFAFNEGLINHVEEIRDLSLEKSHTNLPNIEGFNLEIQVSPRCFNQFKQSRKARLGATGCGLCGVESLELALPDLPHLPPSKPLPHHILEPLRNQLFQQQPLGQESGAIHGALLLSPTGESLVCMEDIGRHNALDKVLGYALKEKLNLQNYSVLMSSRCSTELVQKAVRSGLSHLIHLASPSTLAVKLALHYGLTLIHLPKHDAPRIFAPAEAFKVEKHDEEK